MSDGWTLADLRGTAIMDASRTGAVAERNSRRLAEAAGRAVQAREPASTIACKPASQRASGQASTPPEGWLHRLMACPSWTGRRLDPEEELSLWVAAELRRLTRSGALRAVWTAHRVELPIGGKIGAMLQVLCRALGVVTGSSDFVFTWATGAGWIELKTEAAQGDFLGKKRRRTYARPIQRDFREWCVGSGVKHAYCRSVPEVLATLREWGRL